MNSTPESPKFGSLLSAIFLVAGTCVGGGMLALPVATGLNGFLPSIVIMAICWAAMTATALCLVEVSLWMEDGAHISTMTSRILGPVGRSVAWVLYLFICYASIVAYTAGGGIQIFHTLESYQLPITKDMGNAIFIAVFGLIVYLGSKIVGRANAILFIAMVAAYVGLVATGIFEVKLSMLERVEWRGAYLAIPILLTSFSFQTLVPSLTPFLKRNVKALRTAIVAGTTVTLLIYAIWQWLVLGIVPVEGLRGLADAYVQGEPASTCLSYHTCSLMVSRLAEYFAFLAIVTSFFGIALGLFDFLSDGLKISKQGIGGVVIAFLIMIPTYIFSTQFERVFLVALDTTGGFGDTILNGMIPILMVWIGRYRMKYQGPKFLFGGRPVLAILFAFYLAALVLSTVVQMGFIPELQKQFDMPQIPYEAEILAEDPA